jgi:2-polyprenyl-3-methyl-5-hydroxy-6-metoxy-1,4-benzoquinol methylase
MSYHYMDQARWDVLRMVPADGRVIGSIGCGRAATEAVLQSAGREIHGVDISAEAVATAAGRIASARLVSPTPSAHFAPNSLDGLILADVLEHVPKAWDALKVWSECVKPGGWIVISAPNLRNLRTLWTFVIRGEWPEEASGLFDETHIQVMTHRRLVRWCDRAGLTCEKWFDMYPPKPRWRYGAMKSVNFLTFGLAHSWMMYQLQVRCRRSAVS